MDLRRPAAESWVWAALAFGALVLVRGGRARPPGVPRPLSYQCPELRGALHRLPIRRGGFVPDLPSFASFRWRFCRRGGIRARLFLLWCRGGVVPSGDRLAGPLRFLRGLVGSRFLLWRRA